MSEEIIENKIKTETQFEQEPQKQKASKENYWHFMLRNICRFGGWLFLVGSFPGIIMDFYLNWQYGPFIYSRSGNKFIENIDVETFIRIQGMLRSAVYGLLIGFCGITAASRLRQQRYWPGYILCTFCVLFLWMRLRFQIIELP